MNTLLTELAPSLQKLVDARLDNIDRALLSTDIGRYERRQIVSAVEDQIQELVARIDKDDPSREDILRVLASLDPPEAYGSGSMQPEPEHDAYRSTNRITRTLSVDHIKPKGSALAVVSVSLGAAGILGIPGVFFVGVLAWALSGMLSIAAMICGIVALCLLITTKGPSIGKGLSILGIVSFPVGLVLMFLLWTL